MTASNPLPAKKPARIIIVDDHKIFRDGFKTNLRKCQEVLVVGEADDGAQGLQCVAELSPDVVFMDISMPVMDGIAATREIRSRFPYVHVIALSADFSDWMITDMIEAGAVGYLLKKSLSPEIIRATELAMKGETYYCSEVANRVVELNRRTSYNPLKPFDRPEFIEVEKNIITGICESLTNKEIAAKLGMETRQVERIIDRISEKISRITGKKCMGRTDIAMFAVKHHMYKCW